MVAGHVMDMLCSVCVVEFLSIVVLYSETDCVLVSNKLSEWTQGRLFAVL